jgi:general secretion pathway protein L
MAATPGIAAARPVPVWRQRLSGFWRWWTGELSAFARERFGAMGAARTPIVAVEPGAVVLLEPRGGRLEEARRVPIETLELEGRRRALRDLLAGAGEEQKRLRLCLARDEALIRRVSFPLATEENLSQVLAFEMDRLTPFSADDVYFDHRVVARNAAAEKIDVELAVARRDLVDQRIARLSEWGGSVQGVVLAEDAARSQAPLDLLPESRRGVRDAVREIQVAKQALAVVVGLLLVLALVLPLWQKRETVVAMHPVIGKARQEAEATSALSLELEKLVNDYNFLLARKHGSRPALALVEEVTRLLPDNTWVQQLDVRTTARAREVQISGESTSSSKLIEILEQSTQVQNAAPRGTVTRGTLPGTERFVIAAEARPLAPPERSPVTTAPVPVAPVKASAPPAPAAQPPAPAPAPSPKKAPPGKAVPAEVKPVEAPPKSAAKPPGK